MAAMLGLDDEAVRAACAEAAQGEVVEAVNFNAPGQVVIAGHAAAVERAIEAAQGARRQARRLAAGERAVPFVAARAGGRTAARARSRRCTIQPPRIPVVNNVDAQIYARPGRGSRMRWSGRPTIPVRWVECVQAIAGAAA